MVNMKSTKVQAYYFPHVYVHVYGHISLHVRTCNGEYAKLHDAVLVDAKASFVSYIDVVFSLLLAFPWRLKALLLLNFGSNEHHGLV